MKGARPEEEHSDGPPSLTAMCGASTFVGMEHAGTDPDAFNAFEAAGWEERAQGYDRAFRSLTSRLAEPLLDAASVTSGTRVLDIASGPGYVAGRAAARGAEVVGVDVAEAMVMLARQLQPGVEFRQADAHALPFADGSFDAVLGNFAILHLGRPEQAAAEFVRVLAPGGRLALTVWDAPDRARFLGVLIDAFAEAGATPPEGVPAGPDFFRFANDEEFDALLRDQGLEDRLVETIEFTFSVASADEDWDSLLGGTVRVSALVLGQAEDTQLRIRDAFHRQMDEYRTADGFELPVSVKLGSGRNP
jgi:ubiquinone/menaquinone biosynthesis C-methylase UbiE